MTRYVMLCPTRKVHHLALDLVPICGEPDTGHLVSRDAADLSKRPLCTRCLARVRDLATFLPPTTTVSIEGYVGSSIDELVTEVEASLKRHRRRLESVR